MPGRGARHEFRFHDPVPSPSLSTAAPPCPYLFGRLGVQVWLQQRHGELDLPWAVIRLHGVGHRGGGTRTGKGALPFRCAPAPALAGR